MKNPSKLFIIILSAIIILIPMALFLFYYFLGIGFGKAVVKTAEGVKTAQREWAEQNFYPIDTIKNQIIDLKIDSLEIKERKNKTKLDS